MAEWRYEKERKNEETTNTSLEVLVPCEGVDGLMEVGYEGGPGEDGKGVQGLAPVRQLLQHRFQELRHARQSLRHVRKS
jgi:hypothetical protein